MKATRVRLGLAGLLAVWLVITSAASASPVRSSLTVEPAKFVITVMRPVHTGAPAPVKVTAVDASGHKLASYNGSATWGDLDGAVQSGTALNPFQNGVSTGNALTASTPMHSDRITVTDGTVTSNSSPFNVFGPVTHFAFAIARPVEAGSPSPITVDAEDAVNNHVYGYDSSSVSWSDSSGAIAPGTPLNQFVNGVSTDNTITVAQPMLHDRVTVTDGTVTSLIMFPVHGPLSTFKIVTGPAVVNTPEKATVYAEDVAGNVLPGYSSSSVTWSDTAGAVPPGTSLIPFHRGRSQGNPYTITANVTSDTFTVTDQTITGMRTIAVSGGNGPVNTVPGPQTVDANPSAADTHTLVFSTGNGNAITTSDPAAGSNPVPVSLSVSNGTLTLSQTTGLSFSAGGNDTGSMTFSGSVTDINAALEGLTYQPATGYVGGDTLNLSVGQTNPAQSQVSITVSNTAPSAGAVSYSGAVGNTTFGVGTSPSQPSTSTTGNVLSNSSDANGNAISAAPGTIATSQGGSVAMNPDGTFTYSPPAGFTGGNDTFTFAVTDGVASSNATATISVSGRVWYVNDAGSNGNGTSSSPFNALSGAASASASGDDIFLFGSGTPYSGGITLKSGQALVGQSVDLTVAAQTVSSGAGSNPTITNSGTGVTLADGDTVAGITVNGATTGMSATGVNTFSLDSSDVISGSAGDGLDINGGSGTVAAGAAISGSGGHSVTVLNRTGGTISISGPVNDTGTGVVLTSNNAAAETDFTGGLIASTASNPALTAISGGIVTVTGSSNTLATTTADALDIENTAIGSSGLTFQSISAGSSASGPVNGILLTSTGSGPLTVTGTGAAGSGGTIQHASDTTQSTSHEPGAVSLDNAAAVSLTDMSISSASGNGIAALNLPGLTLNGNSVANSGKAGIFARTGASDGTFSLTNNTVTGSQNSAVYLYFLNAGTFTGSVTGNQIGSSTDKSASGSVRGEGIDVYSTGNGGTVTANVAHNTVTGIEQSNGILAAAQDGQAGGIPAAPTLNLALQNNNVDNESPKASDAISISSGVDYPYTTTVCLAASGNSALSKGVKSSGAAYDADGMYLTNDTNSSVFKIVGGPNDNEGAGAEDTFVENFLTAVNTLSAGPGPGSQPALAQQFGSAGFTNAASCPTAPQTASAAVAPSVKAATSQTEPVAHPAALHARLAAWQRTQARLHGAGQ